ncbi:TA2R9 protein, partial [Calyptomena viridis]|nr:TA2R9 protein [Calyptomena viridis]
SQQQLNVTSFGATGMALITFEAFSGMWINAFIISLLCKAWFKKKTLNSNEKILLLLGCSRFGYLSISWVYSFFSLFYPNYLSVHSIIQLAEGTQLFFNGSNLWVSACLCVFYCIKIANFRNSFFIYLKVKIDRIVPWLLLGSVLFSLLIGILVYDISDKLHCNKSTSQGNSWEVKYRTDEHYFLVYFIIGLLFVTSFTAVIFSPLLLLFSLWRHKRNMQTNSMKDLSVDAHIRAMKSILSFLVMYNINFASFFVTTVYSVEGLHPIMFLLYVVLFAFPGVHSLILIFSNSKLENTMLRILLLMKCK